ncbi:uncharacterized protein LOC143274618 [Babylonia areolata]|uniref:uncharacterized protein LOC143274618 n=1 Tax=Babylonia areolata TaxID=304850 RepID=UPI003FD3E031
MLGFVVTLLAVSTASGALHGICHSNHLQMTEAQVVNQLADLCDRDSNGIIKEAEVVVAFSEILGTTLPLSEDMILAMDYDGLLGIADLFGFSVDRHDFINSWHARFHDNHEFIGATFDAFDNDKNGVWNIQEVDGILNNIKATSDDGDGIISRAEFVNYFTAIAYI